MRYAGRGPSHRVPSADRRRSLPSTPRPSVDDGRLSVVAEVEEVNPHLDASLVVGEPDLELRPVATTTGDLGEQILHLREVHVRPVDRLPDPLQFGRLDAFLGFMT